MTRKIINKEPKSCETCLFADVCTNKQEQSCNNFTCTDSESVSEYIEDLEMRHEEYHEILKELDEEDYE